MRLCCAEGEQAVCHITFSTEGVLLTLLQIDDHLSIVDDTRFGLLHVSFRPLQSEDG
jgi:hypothetical protein